MPASSTDHPRNCGCPFCSGEKDFVLPPHLATKLVDGDVVLFAGAGISTENKLYCQSTFYEEVHAELGLKRTDAPSFPQLMSKYCDQPDGRIKLLEKIKNRFEYFFAFDDFYQRMTRFHRALSPLYKITEVVTTNWDDYFERECNFSAFTYDSDLAFWDASKRRLMKIHGSISNFGSIVATEDDYKKSFERLNDGPLGAQLKSLIARKTVVYVGYSLSDDNYLRLLGNISRMMGPNIRQSYIVAPNIDKKNLARAPVPLIPIETDGTYFLHKIRGELSDQLRITRDEAFFHCEDLLDKAAEIHNKTADAFLRTQHPLLIFSLAYQDGLIHALQRMIRMRRSGEYYSLSRVHSALHGYEIKINERLKKSDFWNAAYGMGYQNGLLFLLVKSADDRGARPPFFDFPFNVKSKSLTSILKSPKKALPRDVAKQARIILEQHPESSGLLPDHTPYL